MLIREIIVLILAIVFLHPLYRASDVLWSYIVPRLGRKIRDLQSAVYLLFIILLFVLCILVLIYLTLKFYYGN
jgi:hypothetical protein